MSVRVESGQLASLLTDLVATASPAEEGLPTSAVLLHSHRGYEGSEVGRVDLLVATSTNRYAMGHSFIRAEGQLPGPMLWPVGDVHNVIVALKRKCKGEKEDSGSKHAVKLSPVGDLVEVIEDPAQRDLFGEKLWSTRFPLGDLNDYPRGLWDVLLSGNQRAVPVVKDEKDREVRRLPRVDLTADILAPFVAIAKRRRWVLETYVRHHRLPVHIQIGPAYRGLIIPAGYSDSEGGMSPDGDVYDPDLPARVEPTPADAERVDLDDEGGDDE